MILHLIAPLLFSSVLYTDTPNDWMVETQQIHITKETETDEDTSWATVRCSCVQYALSRGAKIPNVNASDIRPATSTPYVGGTTLFYYPNSGESHVAVNEFVDLERGFLLVSESNFEPCKIGKRWVKLDDPMNRVIGYL